VLAEPFLDLTKTNPLGTEVQTVFVEQGLWAIAFHPKFKSNGYVFVSFASVPFNGANLIVRFTVDPVSPNQVSTEQFNKTAKVSLSWTQWFVAFAPIGIALLILVPLVTYWIYPPEVKAGDEVPKWAGEELGKMGGLSRREIILGALVLLALGLWIFGGNWINATTVALVVISLMLVLKVVSWDDIVKNGPAWNTLAWFATLVALADGLVKVGFVKWFADAVGAHMTGFSPLTAMILLVLVFYVTHYLFASITAHVTAMLPVMLAVGSAVPGIDMAEFALLLCLTLGIMGVLTPFATGPSPVYYGSGYLPAKDYWRLGAVFGVLFIAAFVVIAVPWLALIR
jgi:L-tartrate/succinate antiporter